MSECDRETSIMRRAWLTKGCCAMGKEKNILMEQRGGDSIRDIGITDNPSFLLRGNTLRTITIYRLRKEYFWGQILL